MNLNPLQILNGNGITQTFRQKNILRPCKIVNGKILFIDGGKQAIVQIGNQKYPVRVEAPVEINKEYWFEVFKKNNQTQLKLMEKLTDSDALFVHFGIPPGKKGNRFFHFWKSSGLPFERQILMKSFQWYKETGDLKGTVETVKYMIRNGLPFSVDVFRSLFSLRRDTSISSLFQKIFHELLNHRSIKNLSVDHPFRLLLNQLQNMSATDWTDGKRVFIKLRQLLYLLGYNREKDIKHDLKQKLTLKALIMQLLQNEKAGTEFFSAGQQFIYKLTGLQILNLEKNDLLQLTFTLPVPLPDDIGELTLRLRDKKREDGLIDADFCHIFLDLDMPNLGKTEIQMFVQNRIINLHIVNEKKNLEQIAGPYINALQSNLLHAGYKLSSVKFGMHRKKDNHDHSFSVPSFHKTGRMDVKI